MNLKIYISQKEYKLQLNCTNFMKIASQFIISVMKVIHDNSLMILIQFYLRYVVIEYSLSNPKLKNLFNMSNITILAKES